MGEVLASRADIARLYGRAAFGARKRDLDNLADTPYADVVESLLAVPEGGSGQGAPVGWEVAKDESITYPQAGQLWWLNRMLTTPHPLEERMTLFWHDHFATAYNPEVRGHLLMVQNKTLRHHALGNFRSMAKDLTIDPAMLKWLDGENNVVRDDNDVPNENYARELFELFTLGKFPQVYTETDIRQAGLALSGWLVKGAVGVETVEYAGDRHQGPAAGDKTYLGQTHGDFGAEEYKRVVDVALDQQVQPGTAAKFVAYKMVQNFAYQPQTEDLFADPDPLVDVVAAELEASDWDIKAGMRALLMSDDFRYPDPARVGVRQPIEIAVHAFKAGGIPSLDYSGIINPLRAAGQLPFEPPNVGGWLLGESWLTRTAYLGYWWVTEVARTLWHLQQPIAELRTPTSADIATTGGAGWAAMFGLDDLSPTTRAAIQQYLDSPDAGNENQKQIAIFHLIANSPDWQVM